MQAYTSYLHLSTFRKYTSIERNLLDSSLEPLILHIFNESAIFKIFSSDAYLHSYFLSKKIILQPISKQQKIAKSARNSTRYGETMIKAGI